MRPKTNYRVKKAFEHGIIIYLTFAIFLVMIFVSTGLSEESDDSGSEMAILGIFLSILPLIYIVPVLSGFFQGLILKNDNSPNWKPFKTNDLKPFIVGFITGMVGILLIYITLSTLSFLSASGSPDDLTSIDYKDIVSIISIGLINGLAAQTTKESLALFYPRKEVCPRCGFVIEEPKNFCPQCGTYLKETYYCTECGSIVDKDDKFCPVCGKPLDLIDGDSEDGDLENGNSEYGELEESMGAKQKKIRIKKKKIKEEPVYDVPDNAITEEDELNDLFENTSEEDLN